MVRFYALMTERDLFGHVVLVPHWGKVGSRGQKRLDEPTSEEGGSDNGQVRGCRRRRGYQDL